MKWILEIKMQSMLLPELGTSGAVVDTEIVHDKFGIPYLPARRIKGLLRESALEVCEMFQAAKVDWVGVNDLYTVFGTTAASEKFMKDGSIVVYDCHIDEYENMKHWLEWLGTEYNDLINSQTILDWFTDIHYQTAIENGVAEENALRSCRAIARPLCFTGEIQSIDNDEAVEKLLALACANLRHMGTMRNRGVGQVTCQLLRPNGTAVLNALLERCGKEYVYV